MRYLLKGCARSGGDLYEGWDALEGIYAACLQCGHRPGGVGSGAVQAAASASRATPVASSHRARPP